MAGIIAHLLGAQNHVGYNGLGANDFKGVEKK
jgi:hypothetical protein